MTKREQAFTTPFQKWLRNRWKGGSAYFEIKATEYDYLNFKGVKDHQLSNLRQPQIIYKFSDIARLGTPFDVILCEGVGYVVINFNYPSKDFYIIPVLDYEKEMVISRRKSLTVERAEEIGKKYTLGV